MTKFTMAPKTAKTVASPAAAPVVLKDSVKVPAIPAASETVHQK